MPNRRPFGSVLRRRLPGAGPGGKPRYAPGFYVRYRVSGHEVTPPFAYTCLIAAARVP
jgi:hypothetical protein